MIPRSSAMRAEFSAAACSGMASGREAFDDFDELVLGIEVLGAAECDKRCMKVEARLAESYGDGLLVHHGAGRPLHPALKVSDPRCPAAYLRPRSGALDSSGPRSVRWIG